MSFLPKSKCVTSLSRRRREGGHYLFPYPVFAIGAATLLVVMDVQSRRNCDKKRDGESECTKQSQSSRDSRQSSMNYSYFSSLKNGSTIFLPSVTNCEFLKPQFPKLARSRTIRTMEDTSTKATLKSKYDVKWGSPLGEGGFGAVYIAVDRKTKEHVAVKKISKQYTDDTSFQREMNAFLHIRDSGGHPHICGLRENFDEADHYFLVLDLVSGGEMFDHLCSHGAYSEADAARLVREVGSALAFLHGTGCVHGDLKPENLMLSSQNKSDAVIKLVDFGCTQIINPSSPLYDAHTVNANTPGYSPPEMVDAKKKLDHLYPSCDMFSLGVIIYVMLCGVHPFDLSGNSTDKEINDAVLSRKGPPLRKSPITAHLSDSAIQLIEKLLHPNPRKRMTALEMLDHSWVRGETARTGKIADSDKKLSMYKAYKSRLEQKVFESMIDWADDSSDGSDVSKRASLIERSFHMLDPDNRGYITKNSLKKLTGAIGDSMRDDDDDESQLSLSGFSELLADNMKNRYFPAGHVIYHEGDKGDKMYFINSGRVEVSTMDGFKTVTNQGDFFGEGALLNSDGRRSATIRTITPVHALEISREYFEKYLKEGNAIQLSLREKDKLRKRDRAKTILKAQRNMEEKAANKGEHIYHQGVIGDEVFILESGEIDVLVNGYTVFKVKPGEMCGEQSIIYSKPRNTSAVCASNECKYHSMEAVDFVRLMNGHQALKESFRDMCLRREFQKAIVFETKKSFPERERDLREAFDAVDFNKSGFIDLSDIAKMLKQMDSTFTDEEIQEILESLDLDRSGNVSFEEFVKMFCTSKKEQKQQ